MNKARLLFNACVFIIIVTALVVHAGGLKSQGSWETTLQGRDLDGNMATYEAYYDTVLDITWLADANPKGFMTWDDAHAWVSKLSFGAGIDDWRLPMMIDNGNDGCNYTYKETDCGYNALTGSASTIVYSEMASMFYETLGNKAWANTSGKGPQSDWGLTNTGPFKNVQPDYYWSFTEYAPDNTGAWGFTFYDGNQDYASKAYNYHYAWAVHQGDVGVAAAAITKSDTDWSIWEKLLDLTGISR